jgi:hypothetical protein
MSDRAVSDDARSRLDDEDTRSRAIDEVVQQARQMLEHLDRQINVLGKDESALEQLCVGVKLNGAPQAKVPNLVGEHIPQSIGMVLEMIDMTSSVRLVLAEQQRALAQCPLTARTQKLADTLTDLVRLTDKVSAGLAEQKQQLSSIEDSAERVATPKGKKTGHARSKQSTPMSFAAMRAQFKAMSIGRRGGRAGGSAAGGASSGGSSDGGGGGGGGGSSGSACGSGGGSGGTTSSRSSSSSSSSSTSSRSSSIPRPSPGGSARPAHRAAPPPPLLKRQSSNCRCRVALLLNRGEGLRDVQMLGEQDPYVRASVRVVEAAAARGTAGAGSSVAADGTGGGASGGASGGSRDDGASDIGAGGVDSGSGSGEGEGEGEGGGGAWEEWEDAVGRAVPMCSARTACLWKGGNNPQWEGNPQCTAAMRGCTLHFDPARGSDSGGQPLDGRFLLVAELWNGNVIQDDVIGTAVVPLQAAHFQTAAAQKVWCDVDFGGRLQMTFRFLEPLLSTYHTPREE